MRGSNYMSVISHQCLERCKPEERAKRKPGEGGRDHIMQVLIGHKTYNGEHRGILNRQVIGSDLCELEDHFYCVREIG